ncbi:hypothetical protein [Streptomyces sp. NPDC004726]
MAKRNERQATADDLLPLVLTSYGHFTSMRVGGSSRIRGLSLHMERLVRDSETVFGAAFGRQRLVGGKEADMRGNPYGGLPG